MYVFVVDKNSIPLMPTSPAHARRLLKSQKAVVLTHHPFTIKLIYREGGITQPVEYKCDTGYAHIGVSVCTEKRELVNAQYDLLKDEPERHNDQRKYRRTRRNRKTRYRKARFANRRGFITKDGFAPSIRNKRDRHIDIFAMYHNVLSFTTAVFEMGQFDTQVLKAIEEGKPLPQGMDYQHGERYGSETLREAVFTRDGYKCVVCGRGIKEHAILHEHHVGYWVGDRSNRMANLATVCEKCHTTKNHQPGGKLYGLRSGFKTLKEATFMTMVRFDMFHRLKETAPDVEFHMTYGAMTKLRRRDLGIKKSHSNDAYAMGEFHPRWRCGFRHYQKVRRNNRILCKFYDAKVIDTRTGDRASGKDLGCNRTKRSVPRNNKQNLRVYRGKKVSKGRVSVRKQRYQIQPGDEVIHEGKVYIAKGMQNLGAYVALYDHKPINTNKIRLKQHTGGWMLQNRTLIPA